MSDEYENLKRVSYGNGLTFIPVCSVCRRFVKPDDTVLVNGLGELADQPNATCSRHGKVKMIFEGYLSVPEVGDDD